MTGYNLQVQGSSNNLPFVSKVKSPATSLSATRLVVLNTNPPLWMSWSLLG